MAENFKMVSVAPDAARTELHDLLDLTGCEASVNTLPAGAAVPFVHAHKQNEELYGVLAGRSTGFWPAAANSGLTEKCAPSKPETGFA